MKKRQLAYISLLVSLLLVLMCGCGAAKNAYDVSSDLATNSKSAGSLVMQDSVAESDDGGVAMAQNTANSDGSESTGDIGGNTVKYDVSRKLIKDASVSLQTKEFDSLMANLDKAITACGGYVSSNEIGGSSYYYSDSTCRWATVVARIPAEKLDEFLGSISAMGKVVSKRSGIRDVTSDYIDVESHLTALKTEQTALLALLGKDGASLEEIIAVQDRLSEVRAEIESYEKQRRVFDDLISYSTVTLSLEEVERVTVTPENDPGAWQQIKENFVYNLRRIASGLREFFISLVSALPFIVLWLAVALAAFFIIKAVVRRVHARSVKKRSKEKNKPNDSNTQETDKEPEQKQ